MGKQRKKEPVELRQLPLLAAPADEEHSFAAALEAAVLDELLRLAGTRPAPDYRDFDA